MKLLQWKMMQALHNEQVTVVISMPDVRGYRSYAGIVYAHDDVISIKDSPTAGLSTSVILERDLDADVTVTETTVKIDIRPNR